ncbi:MAG: dihydroneopterin aldolase [Anaerolineales bacterium]
MDYIIINDLLVRGIIGVNNWERENPQDILVNIVITADLKAAGKSDKLEHSVNYRTISKKVIAHIEKSKRFTVEALAADIADICLAESGTQKVLVRVEKPGAVRFAKSVGVEIERSRNAKR